MQLCNATDTLSIALGKKIWRVNFNSSFNIHQHDVVHSETQRILTVLAVLAKKVVHFLHFLNKYYFRPMIHERFFSRGLTL